MDGLRTFLRYGQLVVELGERSLVLGRGASCDIVLEDELASREHCRIEAAGERVVLTDLDSKNGVLVNGLRVSDTHELHHGDCVTVGTQQLVLMRQHRAPKMTPAAGAQRPASIDEPHEPTTRGDIFQILRGAARASLAQSDLLGAETTARNLFVAVRAVAARGRELPSGVLDEAIELALELASQSGEVGWLEQALDTLVAFRATLSVARARKLVELAERLGTPRRALTEYLRSARETGGEEESIAILGAL